MSAGFGRTGEAARRGDVTALCIVPYPLQSCIPPVADLSDTFRRAIHLALGLDVGLLRVITLSLGVSLGASVAASLLGLPLGGALAVLRFPGRRGLVLLANALLGLPPVVVGLVLYLLLSRAGPLGTLGRAVQCSQLKHQLARALNPARAAAYLS